MPGKTVKADFRLDLLIFDMDGVLIDVSESYRATIQNTVVIYLKHCLGFEVDRSSLVTNEYISLFKSMGGFNNDWDLTSGLLLYLLSSWKFPPSRQKARFSQIDQTLTYLREASSKVSRKKGLFSRRKELSAFAERVKSSGGGLKGVRQVLRRTEGASWEGWVYGSGELSQENLVKRIFQEVYLGDHFILHYRLSPLFYKGPGYYRREKLLIPRRILASLHHKLPLGIASGRPRFEAELALRRFRLLPYFQSVVTLDECEEEEARLLHLTGHKIRCTKPHPYPLLRVVQEIGIPDPRCGYVGDVVDDMQTAVAARRRLQIVAIGFVEGHDNPEAARERLQKAGADRVIEHSRDLLQLV